MITVLHGCSRSARSLFHSRVTSQLGPHEHSLPSLLVTFHRLGSSTFVLVVVISFLLFALVFSGSLFWVLEIEPELPVADSSVQPVLWILSSAWPHVSANTDMMSSFSFSSVDWGRGGVLCLCFVQLLDSVSYGP